MIPLELLPIPLRSAGLEEQLSYLLARRRNLERLIRSLEKYASDTEGALPEGQRSPHGPIAA